MSSNPDYLKKLRRAKTGKVLFKEDTLFLAQHIDKQNRVIKLLADAIKMRYGQRQLDLVLKQAKAEYERIETPEQPTNTKEKS